MVRRGEFYHPILACAFAVVNQAMGRRARSGYPGTRLAIDCHYRRALEDRSAAAGKLRDLMENLQRISDFFDEHKLILTTAESCTAGLIVSTFADLPGCGSWLEGGFVTYSPEAKQQCLGVNLETIEKFNLTSEEVAREMTQSRGRLCDRTYLVLSPTIATCR